MNESNLRENVQTVNLHKNPQSVDTLPTGSLW